MKRWWLGASVIGLSVVAGCTPAQHQLWLKWHSEDPVAAQAFADQWVADHLTQPQRSVGEPASSWGRWDPIIECESGGDWDYNGGSGYDGAVQFHPSTWRAYGGREFAEYAWQAEPWQQIEIAERVLADVGWSAWPTCSRRAGYR